VPDRDIGWGPEGELATRWRGVRELSQEWGWPVHTHALEPREESAAVRATHGGRDEIEYFDDTGLLGTNLRLAHGVWISAAHRRRARPQG
jgi:cytosine/adenosine deaminase-related metal-dependent hydrolase